MQGREPNLAAALDGGSPVLFAFVARWPAAIAHLDVGAVTRDESWIRWSDWLK